MSAKTLTLDVLREWASAYDSGEDVPENVMRQLFELAAYRLTEIEEAQ